MGDKYMFHEGTETFAAVPSAPAPKRDASRAEAAKPAAKVRIDEDEWGFFTLGCALKK